MTDRDYRLEELSTVSTNDDSPRQDKSLVEIHPLHMNLNMAKQPSKELDKTKENEQKIEKLSSYVLKLKKALEQQTLKMNEQNKEIESLKNQNLELENLVNKFVNEEQNSQVEAEKIKKISCKIKVDAVNWLCLKFDDKVEWHREESLKERLSNIVIPPELDPLVELERKKQDEKKIRELKEQLDRVIGQYESRVVYMQQQLDITETKLQNLLQENKKQTEEQGNKIGEIVANINALIDESSEIRENSLLSFNEEADATLKTEASSKMKLLLNQLQKLKFDSEQTTLNSLRTHFLMLHQTLYDLLKKLHSTNAEIITLEKRWKKKCEGIFLEKENEKKEKAEIVEVGRKKIKELEENLDALRIQCSRETKERDFKIDFLTKEVKKNVNIEYIRNILVNFLTNRDYTVREKLLPVIATVLQFSSNDLETVKYIWEKEHTSTIAKGGSTVTNWLNNKLFTAK